MIGCQVVVLGLDMVGSNEDVSWLACLAVVMCISTQ